jgi:hypothetical protein
MNGLTTSIFAVITAARIAAWPATIKTSARGWRFPTAKAGTGA